MKASRRLFLKSVPVVAIAATLAIWDKLTRLQLEQSAHRLMVFPIDRRKPVIFADEYIIINQNGQTRVLSAHCTHLGCKILEVNGGKLCCPCHGSEYDLEGRVLKGPAYKDLPLVKSKLSADGTQIEIES